MSKITNNDFTTEDIKNSVEYRWHKKQTDVHFWAWLILAIVMFVTLLVAAIEDLDSFWLTMLVWAICTAVVSIPFVCAIIRHHSKNKYLLKHFAEFARYEVILNNPHTSYNYRRSVYYTVTVYVDGVQRNVNTNACFSDALLSAGMAIDEYNNKRVAGLYDEQADKFYVIKKV